MTPFHLRERLKSFLWKDIPSKGISGHDDVTGKYFFFPLSHISSFHCLCEDKIRFKLSCGNDVTLTLSKSTPENAFATIQKLNKYFRINLTIAVRTHRNTAVGGKLGATNGSASLELRGKRHDGLQSPHSS